MYELTGLDSYDWLVIGLTALGIALVLMALLPGSGKGGGYRRLIPFVGGLVTVVVAFAAQPSRTISALVSAVTTFPPVAVTVGLAIVVYFGLRFLDRWLVPRLAGLISHRTPMSRPTATDLVMCLALAAIAGAALWVFLTVDPTRGEPEYVEPLQPEAREPFGIGWQTQLPGHPMDLAYHEEGNALYVTLGEGTIVRLALTSRAESHGQPEIVATDLIFPKGIALLADRLYVAETGDLPCQSVFPKCTAADVVGADEDGHLGSREAMIVEASRGRILEYAIGSGGALTFVRPLLEELPVVNTDRGVNGLTVGRDGYLYVSIGGPDELVGYPEDLEAVSHPNKELVGTVLRVDVNDGSFEIVARGIRNVNGTTIDSSGELWGVDNGGASWRGLRREELIRIIDGAHFGFPQDGSAPPFEVRTDFAAYTLNHGVERSAGIQWIQGVEGRDGVLLGSAERLEFLRLDDILGVYKVPAGNAPVSVIASAGVVVSIERVSLNTVVYAEHGPNRITLLTWR